MNMDQSTESISPEDDYTGEERNSDVGAFDDETRDENQYGYEIVQNINSNESISSRYSDNNVNYDEQEDEDSEHDTHARDDREEEQIEYDHDEYHNEDQDDDRDDYDEQEAPEENDLMQDKRSDNESTNERHNLKEARNSNMAEDAYDNVLDNSHQVNSDSEQYYHSKSNPEMYNIEFDGSDEDSQEYNFRSSSFGNNGNGERALSLEEQRKSDNEPVDTMLPSVDSVENHEILENVTSQQQSKRAKSPEKKYQLLNLSKEEIRQRFLRRSESKTIPHRLTGSVYEGPVQNLRMESDKSVYKFPNGDYYEGGYLNGAFHGEGVIYFSDGAQLRGNWIHGELKNARYFFKDNLEWKEEDWEYCKAEYGDRRLWTEIVTHQSGNKEEIHENTNSHSLSIMHGIRPAVVGHSYVEHLQNLNIVQVIPKGTYDTGDGYFDKDENVVKDYKTGEILRQVSNEERENILAHYRIGRSD